MLIPSIDFKVIVKKATPVINTITKITAVFGRLSKFKNGPNIVNRRPIILETKNLGKRKTFSQKSVILNIYFLYSKIHLIVDKMNFFEILQIKEIEFRIHINILQKKVPK